MSGQLLVRLVRLLLFNMGLDVKVGQFAKSASNGAQAITGLGFQPKIIFVAGTQRTTNDAYASTIRDTIGMATASEQMYNAYVGTAQNPIATGLLYRNASGTENFALTSFDADGFTINNSGAVSAYLMNYLALGGSDITNAKILTVSLPGATGSQAITGLGFQPDAAIIIGKFGTASVASRSHFTLSFLSSSSLAFSSSDYAAAAGGGTASQTTGQKAIKGLGNVSGATALDFEATLTSFDSDGLTLNWGTVATGTLTAQNYYILCIKGIQTTSGQITQPATSISQSITGFGFTPKALFVGSDPFITTNDSISTTQSNRGLYGFTDGTSYNCVHHAGGATTTSYLINLTNNNGGSVYGRATTTSLDSDGVTLNWTSNDGTQRLINYMAFGAAAVASSSPTITGISSITGISTITF